MIKKAFFLYLLHSLFYWLCLLSNAWIKARISNEDVEQAKTNMSPLVFQGTYLQERMLQEPSSMPLYGSSELNRFDPFHPYNYTRAINAPYSTFMIGRGGMQSITHFLNFAAQEKNLKDKKWSLSSPRSGLQRRAWVNFTFHRITPCYMPMI